MQAHPHTSCHPLRHENLPAIRSSSKLPVSIHAVLTESRASDQEEDSAFDSDRRSGVACSLAYSYSLRHHLLSTYKFGVLACIDKRMLSVNFRLLRSEASVVHPFRPSFHGPSFPYFQRTDSHVFVAPCSSSPSPGRCGLIRSSLPSPGQCGLHTLVALLVTAIRLRVGARPPLLVTAITGSVRPRYRCSPSHSHLLVAASRSRQSLFYSNSHSGEFSPSLSLFSLTRAFFPLYFSHTVAFCVLCFVLCFVFCVCSDARFFRLTVRHTVVPHPRISHGMQ